MSHVLIGHIILYLEIMDTMNCDSSIVCLPDCIVTNIRLVDSSNHVEMDWISSKLEGLTHIEELSVLDSSNT